MKTERATCFSPVYDEHSTVLILGTLPSVGSVKNGFYYLGKGNAFWELLSYVTGVDYLTPVNEYKEGLLNGGAEEKLKKVKKLLSECGVALFDTVAAANRSGSLDKDIRKEGLVLQADKEVLEIIKRSQIKKIFCTREARKNLYSSFGGKRNCEKALLIAANGKAEAPFAETVLSPSASAIMYGQVTKEQRKKDWERIRPYLRVPTEG